jgi:hypothetical protein
MKRTFGKGDDAIVTNKKNAFRYPKDPSASFPQHKDPVFVDRRTRAIPAEMLIKEKGIKNKNLKKKLHQEGLEQAFKDAYDKVEGTEREGQVIDINNMDMDYELEKLNLGEKKKKADKKAKAKSSGMDLDVEENKPTARRSGRKTKKRKSHYIINY